MDTSIHIAFIAGILSVLSPCIFPLIPSYFAYISGTAATTNTSKIVFHAILFTLGFSIVFLLFGAVIGSIGEFLLTNKRTIEIIGGCIILLFAIQMSGLASKLTFGLFKFLSREFKLPLPKQTPQSPSSPLKSLLAGTIFAFAWSPCYGPILGSILTLTLVEASFYKGVAMFGVYSLGMAIPFILLALLSSKVSTILSKTAPLRKYFNIIMAILLLLLAIGMITGNMGELANKIDSLYIKYNINLF